MGFLDRFFKKQKEYLDTDESFRAFSPDPDSDAYPLSDKGNNEEAINFLKNNEVCLLQVSSGEELCLSDLTNTNVVFVTAWEPYSAKSIGSIKRKLDSGEVSNCIFVFFEDEAAAIKDSKSDSWYFNNAYVLSPKSRSLKEMIDQAPLSFSLHNNGSVEDVRTGVIV